MESASTNRAQIQQYADILQIDSQGGKQAIDRAKACISNFTADERDYFLKVISTNLPPQDVAMEKKILNKLRELDNVNVPITDRDAGKNLLRQVTSSVSRVMQNALGDRKSTSDTLRELQNMGSIGAINMGGEDRIKMSDEKFKALLEEGLRFNGERELDCKSDYGRLRLDPGASPETVDKAFIKYMNEHPNENDRKMASRSYERIKMLEEAESIFSEKLKPPLTLNTAYLAFTESNQRSLEGYHYERGMKLLTLIATNK